MRLILTAKPARRRRSVVVEAKPVERLDRRSADAVLAKLNATNPFRVVK